MQDSIAQQIQKEAQSLLNSVRSGANISESLNSILNRFLVWPFRAGAVRVTDHEENSIDLHAAIHTASENLSESQRDVNSAAVACAIYEFESLGTEELQLGYKHVSAFKLLKRSKAPDVKYPVNFSPLGVVFAIESKIPIENIAEEILKLNKNYPSTEWPDLVVVLTKGSVNYAFQFIGEPIKGDFLLPDANTTFPVSHFTVHIISRGYGLFSFNKMLSLIFMHLMTFSPGTKLPIADEIMEGSTPLGITIGAYQYNLKRQLVPARKHFMGAGFDRSASFSN